MAIGKIGSFATTEAPKDYIGDALQNVENQGFRYRAERRLAEEKKDAAKVEEEKQLAEHLKNFNIDLTGSQSIDDLSQSFAQESFGKYAELARQLQTTTDPNERLKLRTEQSRINQNISAIKQIPGILKEKVDFIAKNIKDLNPDDVNIIQDKLGMLEKGNAKVYLDENKVPRINIYKVDENGKVTDILEKEQTVAEFINGINPHMKSSYSSLLESAVKNTKVSDIKTRNGINITQTKGVDDAVKEEKSNSFADMIINNPDEAYAFAKAKGIDVNNKESLKKAVKQDFINSLDFMKKEDIDSSLITATKPDKGSGSGKEEKLSPNIMWSSKTVVGKEYIIRKNDGTTREMTDEEKKKHKGSNFVEMGGIKVPVGTMIIPTTDAERDMGNGKKVFVNGIGVSPDGNNFYIKLKESGFETETSTQGSSTDKQSSSSKVTRTMVIDVNKNATDAAVYAKLLGYSNLNDFKQDILNQTGVRVSKQPTPKSGGKPATKKETAQERIARLKRQKGLK
jgi:hypothetical protein